MGGFLGVLSERGLDVAACVPAAGPATAALWAALGAVVSPLLLWPLLPAVVAALGAGDLSGRVPERGADLVDLHLHDRALLPGVFVVPGAGHEAALDDDAHALGE